MRGRAYIPEMLRALKGSLDALDGVKTIPADDIRLRQIKAAFVQSLQKHDFVSAEFTAQAQAEPSEEKYSMAVAAFLQGEHVVKSALLTLEQAKEQIAKSRHLAAETRRLLSQGWELHISVSRKAPKRDRECYRDVTPTVHE